jgi:hypothetical protein
MRIFRVSYLYFPSNRSWKSCVSYRDLALNKSLQPFVWSHKGTMMRDASTPTDACMILVNDWMQKLVKKNTVTKSIYACSSSKSERKIIPEVS